MTSTFIPFLPIFVLNKLKLSTYDSRPLSAEDQSRSVMLAVTQHEFSPWTWNSDGDTGPRTTDGRPISPIYDVPVENINLSVTADGVMSFQIDLSDSVSTLDIEVRTLPSRFPPSWYRYMYSRSMSTGRTLDLSSSWCCFQARFEDTVQRLQLYRSYSSPSRSYMQLHRDSEPQVLKLCLFHAVMFVFIVFSLTEWLFAGRTAAVFDFGEQF